MANDFPDATTVSAFLDKNPAFLKSYLENQTKYFSKETLNLPVKKDEAKLGKNIIDMTNKFANRTNMELGIQSKRNLSLVNVSEASSDRWQKLLTVAIGFIGVKNLQEFSEMLDEKLPVIFKLAGARLIMPREVAIVGAEDAGFLLLPEAQIHELKGAQSVYLGPPPKSGLALFSTPMASIALISLPDDLHSAISNSVLLLAGRNKNSFEPHQTDTILCNLSQIVGTCLEAILSQKKRYNK